MVSESILPVVAPELSGRVRAGVIEASPVVVGAASDGLCAEIDDLARGLASLNAGKPPSEIPGLEPARALYRTFGVDPTRTRPSSEALLRRALQGKPLPRISNAVDVCNYCSLRFLLPIGLYDALKIRGAVILRRGAAGESYPGIRKDEVGLEGRLVLSDAEGPFGNPSSDSLRTSVDAGTTALAMVIFAPASLPANLLNEHVRFAAVTMARHLGTPEATPATSTNVLL